jgi:hypothetical protein
MEKPLDGIIEPSVTVEQPGKARNSVRKKRRGLKKKTPRSNAVAREIRTRASRGFPASSFEEALEFARSMFRIGSGSSVRRLTLFNELGKSPESSASRQLITNASKYGLIKGNYKAEQLEFTQDGLRAIDEEASGRERTKTRIKLAIQDIDIFKSLYEKFVGNKLPARAVLIDALKELDVDADVIEEAIDTFIVNLRFVGLLVTLSGADRIITIDHLLDTIPSTAETTNTKLEIPSLADIKNAVSTEHARFDTTCFYVAPIGDTGSSLRKHSDLFLGSIIEPAVEPFKLDVIRADAIDKPGVITKQVIEYLLRSRLVIVDLSHHNPNVFYELAIRHMMRLPVVQIIRVADKVPFDINQMRTVTIDDSDIYSLVPKIESYRSEISTQIRRALDDPDSVDNPITTYYPALKVVLK